MEAMLNRAANPSRTMEMSRNYLQHGVFIEHGDSVEVSVLIWVGRDSQKGIVVGRDGETLKQVGTLARRRMADLLGKRVHLSTWVKVKQGWVDDERALHNLGYDS